MNSSNLNKLILIGASTGGPGLIEKIITALPSSIDTPIIIAQHMDRLSLHSFAKRLQRLKGIEVFFVEESANIQKDAIYILSDTSHLVKTSYGLTLKVTSENEGFYHPTIDVLFESAASLKNIEIISYLLSGIGADGAKGMLQLKESGFQTVAQDEKTSIVYGMPKSALELGAAGEVLSLENIICKINKEV